jgi:lipoprotein-anchoring transpeptidase ErfK/SrfK
VSKHRASRRRAARRRRAGALGGAVALTMVIGAAAIGVLPHLRAASPPASAAGVSTLERASMDALTLPAPKPKVTPAAQVVSVALPQGSGSGRRIVFSESKQRVWLVGSDGKVDRTYLVSGSKFDNLDPGSYRVQSKQRHATAFDSSGTMEYFVRFATGWSAPIGFHTVPVDRSGKLEQTKAQLGTPLSAGCVRQWRDDAIALWNFAPVGTRVVVTA